MQRKTIALLAAAVLAAAATLRAQDLRSGPYELPYKNTYVKEVFVAENPYRTMTPERIEPRPFAAVSYTHLRAHET